VAKNGRQGEGGGRPAVEFDDKDIAQVEALASVMTKSQIADYFGIEENTLRAVERRQPEVFEAYKKGKARAILKVSQNLLAQSNSGNTVATIFYLKTQAGWREQSEATTQGHNVVLQVVNPHEID